MPVTLKQVVEHVAAMDPDIDKNRLNAMVRETIAALGLLVNARNDEVYNPAPAPSSSIPEDNWRKSGRFPRSRR